jgi:anti-anti-sigma regulatory factor
VWVRQAVRGGAARLILDLDAVTGIDAAGIAALLEARRVLQSQAGGSLVLRTNPVVCRALKETGTITAFGLANRLGA